MDHGTLNPRQMAEGDTVCDASRTLSGGWGAVAVHDDGIRPTISQAQRWRPAGRQVAEVRRANRESRHPTGGRILRDV